MFKLIISYSFVSSSCKKKWLIFNHNSNNLTASTIKVLRFSHVFSSEILSFPPAVTSAVSVGSRKNPLQMLSFFFGPFQLFNQPRQSVKGWPAEREKTERPTGMFRLKEVKKVKKLIEKFTPEFPPRWLCHVRAPSFRSRQRIKFRTREATLVYRFFYSTVNVCCDGNIIVRVAFPFNRSFADQSFFCRNKE